MFIAKTINKCIDRWLAQPLHAPAQWPHKQMDVSNRIVRLLLYHEYANTYTMHPGVSPHEVTRLCHAAMTLGLVKLARSCESWIQERKMVHNVCICVFRYIVCIFHSFSAINACRGATTTAAANNNCIN